ncbi:helix-turn-helix transcriptional regulator [Adlercreutzia muris]|uniref:helix-turn-helix transcriptional regulator n=1 Tax=Adlercreutzia muris TaxID=1796610 RepID=UPI001F598F08|nr:LuxR C-terminal-related transcriptional regulator [Adlercreutzia muris]
MNRFKDTIADLSGRDDLLAAGYALYLAFSFVAFRSATLLSPVEAVGHGGGVLFSGCAMAGRIAAALLSAAAVLLAATRGKCLRPRVVTWVLAGLCIAAALAGFLVLAMVFHLSDAVPPSLMLPWLALAGALLGAADLLATLLWARFSATLSLRTVYIYVTVANGASLVLYAVFTLVSAAAVLPLAALLFLVAVLCAKRVLDARAPEEDFGFQVSAFHGLVRDLWHPVLGTAILCFMGGLMLQISGQQDIPLGEFQQTSLWASAAAIACLFVPALVVRKPLNLSRVYSVALPLSAAGFLLLPLIWNAAGGIVNAFAQVGAMVAALILWCMLTDGARRTHTSPTLLFSLALIVTNAAMLAGTLLGAVQTQNIRPGDVALTAVALVSVYLLLIAAIVLFRNREGGGAVQAPARSGGESAPSIEVAPTPEEVLATRCASLAEQYGLTPRERDIFPLLAQGHTMPAISERLFVSENTVKSHAKRIYQKLGIHARAELIDLVNRAGDEDAAREQ